MWWMCDRLAILEMVLGPNKRSEMFANVEGLFEPPRAWRVHWWRSLGAQEWAEREKPKGRDVYILCCYPCLYRCIRVRRPSSLWCVQIPCSFDRARRIGYHVPCDNASGLRRPPPKGLKFGIGGRSATSQLMIRGNGDGPRLGCLFCGFSPALHRGCIIRKTPTA